MASKQNTMYIYGRHALAEALQHAPKAVKKVLLADSMDDGKLRSLVRKAGLRAETLNGNTMPKEVGNKAVHQGAVAAISLSELVVPYDAFLRDLPEDIGPDMSLVLFNEVQDPQNVGAVIRSAAAFGVSAVLIPEHNQAHITGTVAKVSAGMAFRLPLVAVKNENNVIRDLKDRGFWTYGLAGEGANDLSAETFDAPALFVLGNEGAGLRQKTREACDIMLSIPIHPQCESLNAATAMSIVLHSWSVQHPKALR